MSREPDPRSSTPTCMYSLRLLPVGSIPRSVPGHVRETENADRRWGPLVLRNEPNVANPNCSSRPPSVSGVELIHENGGGGPNVEVVNQSYEADHGAPTPTIAWHHREGTEWPAEKLVLARSFAYGFRADRALKGLKTGTPVGSKSETFRVATVRLCSSAVAEMAKSIPLLPIR